MVKALQAILLLSIGSDAAIAYAQECKPVYQLRGQVLTAYVKTPGKYCLNHDISQSRVFDVHAGGFKSLAGTALLKINTREGDGIPVGRLSDKWNYQIDLLQHKLKSSAPNMVGIENWSGGLGVRIENGYIEVPGDRYPSAGISLRGEGTAMKVQRFILNNPNYPAPDCAPTDPTCEDVPASDATDKKAPTYKSSDYLIKNMEVHAGWRGVVMGGANNVLINSTIEVDGHTAVYLFGPGSVIEGNTIIVHGNGAAKPFDAAIKLRDAHGAVVRNNRIIYKGGWFGKAPAAINLLDSTGVLIENNTIENFDSLVRSNGESKYVEKINVLK